MANWIARFMFGLIVALGIAFGLAYAVAWNSTTRNLADEVASGGGVGAAGKKGLSALTNYVGNLGGGSNCVDLAAGPLETTSQGAGWRIDQIDAVAAIEACKSELDGDDANPAKWRYLYRAYKAGISYAKMNEDSTWPLAVEALKKASELGDLTASVYLTILNIDTRRSLNQIRSDAKALEGRVEEAGLSSAQDRFALAVLKTAIAKIDGNDVGNVRGYADMIEFRNGQFPSFEPYYKKAGEAGGYLNLYTASRELQIEGVCQQYDLICDWVHETVARTQDPNIYLGMAVENITEAYRQVDIGFAKRLESQEDRQHAADFGDSWARQAVYYARKAAAEGGDAHKEAARDIETAFSKYGEYANRRFQNAGKEAAAREAQDWAVLGGLLATAIALSEGDGTSEADAAESWQDRNERIDCATATMGMYHYPSGIMHEYYLSERVKCP